MSDRADPFDALRRPFTPTRPRIDFAVSLRRRVMEELGMTITDELASAGPRVTDHGRLALVRLAVGDADRAMRFFGQLFGWEAERVLYEGHVNHYTVNTAVTLVLHDDPAAPPVRPCYRVRDVAVAVAAIEERGGTVTASELTADGGGWAHGEDDQGLPFNVYRPSGDHAHEAPTAEPMGDIGLVFVEADAPGGERFYGPLLDWRFERAHPDSQYFDTVAHVGVFDRNAAFGTDDPASLTLYISVAALRPILARVEELGGTPGPTPSEPDMGPYVSTICADDQGTRFGLIATTVE